MKNSDPAQTIAKLSNSKVFRSYASAFEGATGISLTLQGDPNCKGDAGHRVAVKLGESPVAFLQLEAAGGEVTRNRFESAMTIAKTFACQLSEIADRILLEQQAAEPAAIVKAKRYIIEKLDEPLRLDEVAAQVQVSPFYFCKLFKGTTGMTFTEFVNRQRIERAKRRLLDPSERITEIAYGVGYQSLSQFNRSFHRIVGESPTQFRKRMGVGKSRFQLVA